VRVIFRPSLATPSLPAHRSLILQNPSAGRLLRVSTLDIHKKTYEDLRNGWYKCVACDNDLAVPDAIMLRCASRCSVIHFTCKKPWCMSLGARSHCPGCDLHPDEEPCWCKCEESGLEVPEVVACQQSRESYLPLMLGKLGI
jgi:hypothetical protein